MPVRKNSYDLHVWHNATIPLAGRSKRLSSKAAASEDPRRTLAVR